MDLFDIDFTAYAVPLAAAAVTFGLIIAMIRNASKTKKHSMKRRRVDEDRLRDLGT